jgi:hypothetical protein
MKLVSDAQLYDNMGTGPKLIWEKSNGEEIDDEQLEQLKLHLDLITDKDDKEYTERLDSSSELQELNRKINQEYLLYKKDVPEELLNRREQLKLKVFGLISTSGSEGTQKALEWEKQSKNKNMPEDQKSKAALLAAKYGLTKSEMAAIFIFTANDYKYMNPAVAGNLGWLKSALPEVSLVDRDLQKLIFKQSKEQGGISEDITNMAIKEGKIHYRYMKSGLNKLPNYVGTTYRGASFTQPEMQQYYPLHGTTTFPAMSSSSIREGQAKGFAESTKTKDKKPYVFTLEMKRGKTVAEFSNSPGEAEIVIMAGAQFSVDSIVEPQDENSVGKVHLTQVR